jgi:hypothetical protein
MIKVSKKIQIANLVEWLKFIFIAVVFPIAAVVLSCYQVSELQSETRLKKFQSDSAVKLDSLNLEPIPKQFLTTADKRLQKENRSNSTIFFPI